MFCSDEAAPHPRHLLGLKQKEKVLERFSSVLLSRLQPAANSYVTAFCKTKHTQR